MTGRKISAVGWGSPTTQDSLYGTALTMRATGEIHLVNDLMPSGTPLQEWYSFTDYQSVRGTPSLPLLHHRKRYRLDPVLTSNPRDTVYFALRFYDQFSELLRTDVLHPPHYAFEYPAQCHHYTVQLVNGGCDELRFTSFALLEVDDAQE